MVRECGYDLKWHTSIQHYLMSRSHLRFNGSGTWTCENVLSVDYFLQVCVLLPLIFGPIKVFDCDFDATGAKRLKARGSILMYTSEER